MVSLVWVWFIELLGWGVGCEGDWYIGEFMIWLIFFEKFFM